MRKVLVLTMLLSCSAMVAPAFALQSDDTMSAWKSASEKERIGLLKDLFGNRDADNARILKCMDETSKTPGHTELNVADVAKVCASAGNAEQPV